MLFGLMSFWGELLWFESLGQTQRFGTAVLARLLTVAVAAAFSAAIVFVLTLPIPKTPPFARTWPQSVAVAVGGVWGWSNWDTLLKWWYAVPTDLRDPIFGWSTGFYLFGLPLLDSVVGLCIVLALITITAAAVWAYAPREMERASTRQIEVRFTRKYEDYRPVYFALGVFALALAAAQSLAVFHLIYSSHGVVTGPGWTDVHVRVPALIVLAITTAAMGVLLFVRPVTARLHRQLAGEALHGPAPGLRPFAVPAAIVAIVWGLSALVVPALV